MEKEISMTKAKNENKKICFVISPIGDEGSDKRRRFEKVLRHIITPAVNGCGYDAFPANKISMPGIITSQLVRHLIDDPLVIADLSETNPKVFYELAIRHFIGKPIVQIIQTRESIPFDISPIRTVQFDLTDPDSIENAKNEIVSQIHSTEDNPSIVDNPITNILKEMNIDIIINEDRKDTFQQFKGLFDKIIDKLDSINNDRNEYLQSLETIMRSNKNIESNIETDLSGEWNSDNGLVRLLQDGNNVLGEYQFGSDDWVGFINGEIITNKIIFKWNRKNTVGKGIGYWLINNNRLEGGWSGQTWYAELRNNPKLTSRISNNWNLWKEDK
jgi:hypothetical protein